MVDITQKLNDRLARWKSFVDSRSSIFMFHVNYPLPELETQLPPQPSLWPCHVRERIERRWAEYVVLCEKAKRVDDDRVPYISNVTGTEIFSEAFGCKVHRPHDNNPFALPLIHSAAEADRIRKTALPPLILPADFRNCERCSPLTEEAHGPIRRLS